MRSGRSRSTCTCRSSRVCLRDQTAHKNLKRSPRTSMSGSWKRMNAKMMNGLILWVLDEDGERDTISCVAMVLGTDESGEA
jgi:hypothetical protein